MTNEIPKFTRNTDMEKNVLNLVKNGTVDGTDLETIIKIKEQFKKGIKNDLLKTKFEVMLSNGFNVNNKNDYLVFKEILLIIKPNYKLQNYEEIIQRFKNGFIVKFGIFNDIKIIDINGYSNPFDKDFLIDFDPILGFESEYIKNNNQLNYDINDNLLQKDDYKNITLGGLIKLLENGDVNDKDNIKIDLILKKIKKEPHNKKSIELINGITEMLNDGYTIKNENSFNVFTKLLQISNSNFKLLVTYKQISKFLKGNFSIQTSFLKGTPSLILFDQYIPINNKGKKHFTFTREEGYYHVGEIHSNNSEIITLEKAFKNNGGISQSGIPGIILGDLQYNNNKFKKATEK